MQYVGCNLKQIMDILSLLEQSYHSKSRISSAHHTFMPVQPIIMKFIDMINLIENKCTGLSRELLLMQLCTFCQHNAVTFSCWSMNLRETGRDLIQSYDNNTIPISYRSGTDKCKEIQL